MVFVTKVKYMVKVKYILFCKHVLDGETCLVCPGRIVCNVCMCYCCHRCFKLPVKMVTRDLLVPNKYGAVNSVEWFDYNSGYPQ